MEASESGERPRATILILAPHVDDGELGCGATIARMIEASAEVHYVACSTCEESVPDGFPPDVLAAEVFAATAQLGLDRGRVSYWDYPVRRFGEHRQRLLDQLIELREDLRPDRVFLPASTDIHQDHQVVFEEATTAFESVSMLGYELPWNNLSFKGRYFVRIEEHHLHRKLAALAEYASQASRPYMSDLAEQTARVRGVQIGARFAEAFEVLRFVE